MTLVTYLSKLNTSENQWSLFVNPENVDDYRIGQDCFENGGLDDGKIKVASLDAVSFGFQSRLETLESLLNSSIEFKGKKVNFNKQAMIDAFSDSKLGEEFQDFLDQQIDEAAEQNSIWEAEFYVEQLPDLIKTIGQH
jgi:hypothetical protein